MAESNKMSAPPKESESEKKKGFDWLNLVMPGNEEKDHWVRPYIALSSLVPSCSFSAVYKIIPYTPKDAWKNSKSNVYQHLSLAH